MIIGFSGSVNATPNKLTIANAFAKRLQELGSRGVEVTRLINKLLGRKLSVTLYDPGKCAPPGRYFDPIIVGAIHTG